MTIIEKSYLTIEELISLPTLSGINISEDGKNVAFVKNTVDWEGNRYRNHIWIYEKNKGKCRSLTANDLEGTSPLWSPDSRHIAYLRSVGDGEEKKNQIFVESLVGYSRVQMTVEKEGVSKFKWDPAGKGFYYLALSNESEEIKKRKEIYGDYEHVGKDYRNHCLYFVEIKNIDESPEDSSYAGKVNEKTIPLRLTDGKDFHIYEFDISNDGQKVVFIAAPSPSGEDEQNADLYILDTKTGELQKMNVDKLLRTSVCISPNESKICYSASIREKNYYKTHIGDRTLYIYDLNSGEVIHP